MLSFTVAHPLSYNDILNKINNYHTVQHAITKSHDELLQTIRQNKADEFILLLKQECEASSKTIVYLKKIDDIYKTHKFSNSTVDDIYINHIWVMETVNIVKRNNEQSFIIADVGVILNVNCMPKHIDGNAINKWKRNVLIERREVMDEYIVKHGKIIL